MLALRWLVMGYYVPYLSPSVILRSQRAGLGREGFAFLRIDFPRAFLNNAHPSGRAR